MKSYKHNFYKDRHTSTINAANTILSLVADAIPAIKSGVDFGCGVGTWLAVLKEKGAEDILGLEGPWVQDALLKIPKENLMQVDFEKGVNLDKKYDLAISLEVAEHLKPETASQFVKSITQAADFVLFSAAIPFQGGTNHINEQWPDYWVEKFKENGFVLVDLIRCQIWDNDEIPSWYKQNALLFVKGERTKDIKKPNFDDIRFPVSLVHPETYLSKMNKMNSVKGSFKLFPRAVKNWVRDKFKS